MSKELEKRMKEQHGNCRIDHKKIKELQEQGMKPRGIAQKLGIKVSAVYNSKYSQKKEKVLDILADEAARIGHCRGGISKISATDLGKLGKVGSYVPHKDVNVERYDSTIDSKTDKSLDTSTTVEDINEMEELTQRNEDELRRVIAHLKGKEYITIHISKKTLKQVVLYILSGCVGFGVKYLIDLFY